MELYGDLHTHTMYSDGHGTINDNVTSAVESGLRQIAITDHGHGKYKGGMRPKNYNIMRAQIKKASIEHKIDVLFGVEANITGADGSIDITAKERGGFDIVLCGVHRGVKPHRFIDFFTWLLPNYFCALFHHFPKKRINKNTQTVINAVEKNNIDILTHPNRYFKVDVLRVAKACIERGTVLELNAKRISFRPIDFERMAEMGAKFVIGSDAHWPKDVGRTKIVEDFLKKCDYPPDVILNLDKPFIRPKGIVLQEVAKDENSYND